MRKNFTEILDINIKKFQYMMKKENGHDIRKVFLSHIKKCLIDSEISREQNWEAFGWNFAGCNTYEEIEKEVDSK